MRNPHNCKLEKLLELLKDENNPLNAGLCLFVEEMIHVGEITKDEGYYYWRVIYNNITSYFYKNKRGYYFPKRKRKPRIKYLEKLIKKGY